MAGALEIRISQDTLQSFIDAAFPMVVKQDINVLGAIRIPSIINLFNPGPVRLMNPSGGTDRSFIALSMDYAVSSDSGLIPLSKGNLGGDFAVTLSHDQENLVLTFGQMNIQVTTDIKISLASLLKPINVPIFKGFPVKIQNREIIGRFKKIAITVEGNELVIKGDFLFEKAAELKI
ncbi:MAG: hypothetical protein PHN75_17820 [Syntrophales bacterium]|nr:hypothetical protein [Syntrophales bacterium]